MSGYGPLRGGRCACCAVEGEKGVTRSFETSSRETSRRKGEPDRAHQRRPGVVYACSCVLKQRGGMRRSGVLALGAVLMLGGVIGGRGDELSGSVGASATPPSGGFSLPDLSPDWNWSDLPVKLSASEAVSYNSNIFAIPNGSNILTNGQKNGDFTSTSSYGLSTKANWYGQQFFFDGTFGAIRYLHNTQF